MDSRYWLSTVQIGHKVSVVKVDQASTLPPQRVNSFTNTSFTREPHLDFGKPT